jgi:hypothetical protein
MTEPVTHAGPVGQQEHDEVGDLVDLGEFAHGQRHGGFGSPVVAGAVEPALGGVFPVGVGPADVQGVDADLVPAVRVRGIAGQAGQAGLGRDVRGEVGLADVRRRTADVDDGAGGVEGPRGRRPRPA